MFGANDHDLHRLRRAAVSPFFSKGAVRKLQPIMEERLDALLVRFREFQKSHEVMTLDFAFSAFTNGLFDFSNVFMDLLTTVDIAQEYAFARSDHRVEQHDFEPTFYKAAVAGSTSGALIKQWPWILTIMLSMPDKLMIWMDPNMASYFGLQSVSKNTQKLRSSH